MSRSSLHHRKTRRPHAGLTITLVVALLAAGALQAISLVHAPPASADVLTAGVDTGRSGWDGNEPALAPSSVTQSGFGQRFATSVQGQVYAQPLVYGSTVLVATEANWIYGLDAATGAIKWSRNVGVAWNPFDIGCGDLAPLVGITGAPVIDPATGSAYFFSKTYASGSSGPARWYAHSVDVATGVERTGWPLLIDGTADNDPSAVFSPTTENQRTALLLLDGVVYAGFGSHCDAYPFSGWVVGVSTTQARVTARWNTEAGRFGAGGGGIWQSSGGIASDGPGRLLLVTGNGTTPPVGPGNQVPPPGSLAQSVVRLNVRADKTLQVADYFAPSNADDLNLFDGDLGSGAPADLPDSFGTATHPHLVALAGKEGYVYLLDRDNLGGRVATPAVDRYVDRVGPDGGVWSKPSVWPGDGGWIYVPTASPGGSGGGSAGVLHAYRRVVTGDGRPTLVLAGSSADAFGFSSGAPVVTSSGTASGTALVWTIWSADGSGANAELRAYDPIPQNGGLVVRWRAPIGTSAKFSTPAIDNGRIYVGTRDGTVLGFGALSAGAGITGPDLAFPATNVGSTSDRSLTLTATRATSVTALAVTGDGFTTGPGAPALPIALATGQTVTVPIRFQPQSIGSISGSLTVTTSSGAISFGLTGVGQAPTVPIGVEPALVDFGTQPYGGSPVSSSIAFANTGSAPQTVQSVVPPSAPFTVTGAPAPGSVIPVGGRVAMTVTFTPPNTAGPSSSTYSSLVTLETNAARAAIPATATVAAPAELSVDPQVGFGAVPVGATSDRLMVLRNSGGTPLHIQKSKPLLSSAFTALDPLPEGTVLAAGEVRTVRVRFTPTTTGGASGTWALTGDDGSGEHDIALSGTGVTPVPDPSAGGWQVNGAASVTSSTLELTGLAQYAAGSAFWPTPIATDGLAVDFDLRIGDGSGADGMALVLADPASATPQSVGGLGGGLGYAGIPGVAVGFDTYLNAGFDPSFNFVGVASSSTTSGVPAWRATSTAIPALRGTTRHVSVRVTRTSVSVSIDGGPAFTTAVNLSPTALVGFTGGSGYLNDRHTVSAVRIVRPAVTDPVMGGWATNGSASASASSLELTGLTRYAAGSSFWPTPISTAGLSVSFDARIGDGSGADGMALVLANPASSTPQSVGGMGGGLGYAGIDGALVALDTYLNVGDPGWNFVGVGTRSSGGLPVYSASALNVPALRNITHHFTVRLANGDVTVTIDGVVVLATKLAVPITALVGFTGGSGYLNDRHTVSAVRVSYDP